MSRGSEQSGRASNIFFFGSSYGVYVVKRKGSCKIRFVFNYVGPHLTVE
jgi:hypothetical protein